MKKLAAILLTGILLFNCIGYQALVSLMQSNAGKKLEARIDAGNFDHAQLVQLSVPLDLPYAFDWKEFERVDGEITIDGFHYRFVERKFENGRMIYKCIINNEAAHWQKTKDAFVQMNYDLQQLPGQKEAPAPAKFKKVTGDFEPASLPQMIAHNAGHSKSFSVFTIPSCPAGFYLTPFLPPNC